eukprot:CAMPEP_0115402298 /NCGR_PEP_ID=MMETSP0271-20121206/16331_1 /TAXON_ID=71861 /ORGANISM="Scrippsiella trochoidea, Strain CCMP3099" /LENGTH=319 /DNA_ID=CAMNT_0002826239 /DNA_START=153 /DNA_END=1110 /DNA_ORIENTATION=+
MCTGNFILMGRAMMNEVDVFAKLGNSLKGETRMSAGFYAMVIMAWSCGAAAFQWSEYKFPGRGASILSIPFGSLMLLVEIALLASHSSAIDNQSGVVQNHLHSLTIVAYAPMFGFEWAACAAGRLATNTAAASGHILAISTLSVKRCMKGLSAAETVKIQMGLCILAGNLLGAIVGALVFVLMPRGAPGALLPLGPLLAILFWLHDHLAKPLSLVKAVQRRCRASSKDVADLEDTNPDQSDVSDVDAIDLDEDEDDDSYAGSPARQSPMMIEDDEMTKWGLAGTLAGSVGGYLFALEWMLGLRVCAQRPTSEVVRRTRF